MTKRLIPLLFVLALATGCAGPRSYARGTDASLAEAFACAASQLEEMGYSLALVDSVGGLIQGQREITGIRESARRGAAAAAEVITAGLAGGKQTRYDEITVFVFMRHYPQGNTIEATAGLLTVAEGDRTQSEPTEDARRDARALVRACARWT